MPADGSGGAAARFRRTASQPRFARAAAVCVAAVAALTGLSYGFRRPVMERSITRTVSEALHVGGHAGVVVDVDGRDVTLRGTVSTPEERRSVIHLAQSRTGVRVVNSSRLVVAGAATGSASSSTPGPGDASSVPAVTVATLQIRKPRIDATFRDGVLVVTGTTPTKDAADALSHRSSTLLQPGQLVDKVVVATKATEVADMNAYRRLGDFLSLLPRAGTVEASLHYDRGTMTLKATLDTDTSRTFLEREAKNLVGADQLKATLVTVAETTTTEATTTEATTTEATTTTLDTATASGASPAVPATGVTAAMRAAQLSIDAAIATRPIGFAKNSDALSDEGKAVVDDVAAALAKLTEGTLLIQISGYTDDRGSGGGNLALSQRRADAVRKELAAKGIEAARISARGFGEENPIASNDTDENRAKNRRIEIRVVSA